MDFYSIDKLVEFGMTSAAATQMVNSMNQTFNHMQMPGVGKAMPENKEDIYYTVINGEQSGPFSLTDISRLISEKKIVKESYLWKPGMKGWDLAENIPEVLRLVAITPPPVPPALIPEDTD